MSDSRLFSVVIRAKASVIRVKASVIRARFRAIDDVDMFFVHSFIFYYGKKRKLAIRVFRFR